MMQGKLDRDGNKDVIRSIAVCIGLIAILFIPIVLDGCHGAKAPPRIHRTGPVADGSLRAIWVTRWDYKSPRDIAAIMENCRQAGFNTVLFQVRGNGTAFYRSRLEPWADELGGRDPGFDPLGVACQEAHKRGLSLHAWANVMPGWRGKKPPTNPRQLYRARADWFWRDAQGRRQPLGWYNSVNPCYPEVRRYLTDVMHEIVAGYPVDGLHLDYIRFPNEWNNSYPQGAIVPDYPRDPRTLAMFRAETGQTPESSPDAWIRWRSDKVTELVRDIRRMMRQTKPRAMLTAAVGADPAKAAREHFQDTQAWLAAGLLDAVFPMNYTPSMREYEHRMQKWAGMRTSVPIVVGIMADKRDGAIVNQQIQSAHRARCHVAVFAYSSLFGKMDGSGRPVADDKNAARDALRRDVVPQLKRLGTTPA